MNEKTRFTKIIRIDPDQLEWLRKNKDTKTLAGYLDKIINNYKHELQRNAQHRAKIQVKQSRTT